MTEINPASLPNAFFAPPADVDLQLLPKCNLHTHLEGSIRPQTLAELAILQGIELATAPDKMTAAVQVTGEERNLVDYLNKISFAYQALKDPEALRRTSFEAAEDAARDGVIYLELRAGPMTHLRPGLSLETAIQAMLEGLHQAEQKYDIVCRLIVAGLRDHDPRLNSRLAAAAVTFKESGVVGFDLAGGELGYPAQEHAQAFRIARAGGLGITVHAGEAGGADNVRYAVEELGATRIGHGIHSQDDPDVIQMLLDRKILLEICPTSNVHTHCVSDIHDHPVRRYFERGIRLSIGDDDPITSCTRVSNELTLLRQVFGFSLAEIKKIQIQSIEAAFLQDTTLKQNLIKRMQ